MFRCLVHPQLCKRTSNTFNTIGKENKSPLTKILGRATHFSRLLKRSTEFSILQLVFYDHRNQNHEPPQQARNSPSHQRCCSCKLDPARHLFHHFILICYAVSCRRSTQKRELRSIMSLGCGIWQSATSPHTEPSAQHYPRCIGSGRRRRLLWG